MTTLEKLERDFRLGRIGRREFMVQAAAVGGTLAVNAEIRRPRRSARREPEKPRIAVVSC